MVRMHLAPPLAGSIIRHLLSLKKRKTPSGVVEQTPSGSNARVVRENCCLTSGNLPIHFVQA